jgi:hypothetical protein
LIIITAPIMISITKFWGRFDTPPLRAYPAGTSS